MKAPEQVFLPARPESAYDSALQRALAPLLSALAVKLNLLASGRASGRDEGRTTAPTTGRWEQGDQVFNTAPVEAGTGGSKYVIEGWTCVASGEPGTWVQRRTLTGN